MYSLKKEVDILKSKITRYESILEQYPNCILSNLDYISHNDILISNKLNKVDKIDVFRSTPSGVSTVRIVLHAKAIIEEIPIYSHGIDFCSMSHWYDYTLSNYKDTDLKFANYHEELKALKISDSTIKKIEMHIYNKYLIKPLADYKYNHSDYIPHTFKKLLILNG